MLKLFSTILLTNLLQLLDGNNYWVTVGNAQDADGIIMNGPNSSSDGIAWSQRWVGNYQLNGVTFGNNTFVSVGESGNILTSSDNGSTWTSRTSGTSRRLKGVTYGNSIFVAVLGYGEILTSSDGINWTERQSGTNKHLHAVTYSE